jgi:hypothetical protein
MLGRHKKNSIEIQIEHVGREKNGRLINPYFARTYFAEDIGKPAPQKPKYTEKDQQNSIRTQV